MDSVDEELLQQLDQEDVAANLAAAEEQIQRQQAGYKYTAKRQRRCRGQTAEELDAEVALAEQQLLVEAEGHSLQCLPGDTSAAAAAAAGGDAAVPQQEMPYDPWDAQGDAMEDSKSTDSLAAAEQAVQEEAAALQQGRPGLLQGLGCQGLGCCQLFALVALAVHQRAALAAGGLGNTIHSWLVHRQGEVTRTAMQYLLF